MLLAMFMDAVCDKSEVSILNDFDCTIAYYTC